MSKRGFNRFGQITIFIVIAFILIGAIVIILAFRNKINIPGTESDNLKSEVGQIDLAIEDCIRQRAIDAIRIVGLQGGYINLPQNYLVTPISNVAYGNYLGRNTLPLKSTIEKEISYYVKLTIPFCLDDEFNGFNITKSKPNVITKIESNSILITAKMPISAIKDNKAFTIDREHNIAIPFRLGNMIEVANEIVEKEIKNPSNIQINFLNNLKYPVLIFPENNNTQIYALVDISNPDRLNNASLSFLFATKIK